MPRLITFGGLAAENGTLVNGVANPRSRLAILAVIAAAGSHGIRREKLLTLFWPESDEERARNALRQALFTMRRDLGVSDLTVGVTELRLNGDVVTSDVGDFRAAMAGARFEEAVALYRGPFLDGVFVKDSAEFEQWLDGERRQLAADYARALESLGRAATQQGDAAAAVGWWRRLAGHDPFSGRIARCYMEALAAAGHREAAIRHATIHAQLVRDQLGAEPDGEVLALAAQFKTNGSPSAGRSTPAEPTRSAGAATVDFAPPAVARVDPAAAHRNERVRRVGIVAILFVVVAIGAWIVRGRADTRPEVVIVPPFEIETADTALALAGTIAADWITQGIAQTRVAAVVDFRTVLNQLGDSAISRDPRGTRGVTLARLARASMLIDGSVSREGDSIRFDARIVRVSNGRVLQQLEPARASQRDPSPAIEQLRERAMGALATMTDERFGAWTKSSAAPPRYDAYREFVVGLESMTRGDPSAMSHFLAAARLDTTFLQAKLRAIPDDDSERGVALGDSLLRSAAAQREHLSSYDLAALDNTLAFRRGDWEGAYDAARRMVVLAPWSHEAKLSLANAALGTLRFHTAIRVYHSFDRDGWMENWEYFWRGETDAHHNAGDFEGELRDARFAQSRFPRSAGICQLQIRPLAAMGRAAAIDSAIANCSSLPGDMTPEYLGGIAGRELWAHDHRAEARRILLHTRALAIAHTPPRRGAMAAASIYLGDWQPLFDLANETITRDTTDFTAYGQRGVAAAHLGDTATAVAMAHRIESMSPRSAHAQKLLWQGFVYAALDDKPHATELLHDAVTAGLSPTFFFHFNAVYIEPLRGFPPFEALRRPRD
jgi:DNA-binding SARP family transcriptional activator/tetratricopeptide (TPR) repeat protein/TolB-like protein